MALRILIVDDEPKSVQPLDAELRKLQNTETRIVGFDEFPKALEDFTPNVIVLDLARGSPAEKDFAGMNTFDGIWHRTFCPLVVYTAVPELLSAEERRNHPFIKLEPKGSGSEERVLDRIREFGPHLSALDEAGKVIARALNQALRDVAPRIFETEDDEGVRKEMLVRSARRRVAAAMDKELSSGGPNLRSWEHYLCPPTTREHLFTGDIIRKRTANPSDPSAYALVLTPSCDLVTNGKRRAKVANVLVARCKDVQRLLEELAPGDRQDTQERNKKLRAILTRGHGQSCIPIPSLPHEFPPMAADFRVLELIELSQIIEEDKDYVRVASVDSPFRELVAWAYVSCAARPGLPDRDYDSWVEEVVTALKEPEKIA